MTRSVAARSSHASTEAAYGRWAPVYDLIFDLPFHPGRLAAAEAAGAAAGPGGSILVVGVGTGLELPLLRRDASVTGVDISAPMLDIARERVARERLDQVRALKVMNAEALEFDAARFDVALAPYVMSVLPDPARALEEMSRVVRPGGALIVMNHFAAERGMRRAVEAAMAPAGRWLGWHPNFPYAAVGDWLAARSDLRLAERRALAPFSLFTLLRIDKASNARPAGG